MERDWLRVALAGYLAWCLAFFVLEGAGRRACHVPSARWIAEGETVSERNLRAWTRDRADECLDRTDWYAYPMALLFIAAFAAPVVLVWRVRKPIMEGALRSPVSKIQAAAAAYAAAFLIALLLALAPYAATNWFYDHFN